jgi:hypothetical protein
MTNKGSLKFNMDCDPQLAWHFTHLQSDVGGGWQAKKLEFGLTGSQTWDLWHRTTTKSLVAFIYIPSCKKWLICKTEVRWKNFWYSTTKQKKKPKRTWCSSSQVVQKWNINSHQQLYQCSGILMIIITWSHGSSVSVVSDYGLDDRGSIPDRGRGFFLQPLSPDWLWGLPSLLSNGYRGGGGGGAFPPG